MQKYSVQKFKFSNMGRWNENKRGGEDLPIPNGSIQEMVHLCDYIASLPFVDFCLAPGSQGADNVQV